MTDKLMFPEITRTWNPYCGCPHACIYCSVRELASTRLKHLPQYCDYPKTHIVAKELMRKFKKGFIFCCNMGDLWANSTPDKVIKDILTVVWNSPEATFLMLTKNPHRYFEFMFMMPPNVVLGATIETDRYPKEGISQAPSPINRALNLWELRRQNPNIRTITCVEPIIDFEFWTFVALILGCKPEYVYIGLDNHSHHLPEPKLEKTLRLIEILEGFTEVKRKTIRKAWDEK